MKRTKGSQSEVGMMYQYGVTAFLAAQLSENHHVQDYIIYSNENSAGKFDDIVARVKLKNQDDWYLYLIQVKSKDIRALNVSDKLKGKRIEHVLSDHIQCFSDILTNPNLTCRYGIPNDNIRFSFFCTKDIQKPVFLRQDCTFELNVRQCIDKNDVNNVPSPFGNEYFKFVCKDLENSEFQHFFDKCCLYLKQPNFNKLNKLIQNACQIQNTRGIINYVNDYFNDDDLYTQGLSKDVFEIELQRIRFVDAIPPLTSFADLIDDDRITIWNEITTKHDITAVNCMQNFAIEPYLYSCLVQKINYLLGINIDWKTYTSNNNNLDRDIVEKFVTYSKTKELRYWIVPPTTLRLLIIELWKYGDLPLILKTHMQLTNFEKYAYLKRSYIVLDDWTNRSKEIATSKMDIFSSLSSIVNAELQDKILEAIKVSLQGRKPLTLKNLFREDNELMSAFTCADVLRMMRKRALFLKEGYYKGNDYLAFVIEDENCSEISNRIEPYDIGHNFRVHCPPGRTDECIEMIQAHADISEQYIIYHLRKIGKKIVLTQGDPQRLQHRFVDQYGDPLFISNTGEYIPIIGQTIELNELRYIPRQLKRVTVAKSLFSLLDTQICLLSGDLKFIENSIEFSNIADVMNEAIILEKKTYFIRILEKEDRQYYWRKLCHLKYPIFDICVRDAKLELLRYKNRKDLNFHISYDSGLYSEKEYLNEIRNEPDEIAVVTGDSGIGKSSFLKWLCNNYSTQDYIIYYDLINLQVDLNKSERQRIDLIDFIFKETQKDLPKQYTELVSSLRLKKKLIWVLDSFDEIRLACEKQVLDLIAVIANSGAQIVIATRTENCKILMEQFEIRLVKVEPLDQENCVSYWELDHDLLRNIPSELATNPLYLNFLKMISVNREELMNITKYTLYEKVINMKVKHCLRSTYRILDDADIGRAVLLLERLALVAMFGKEVIEKELYWMCGKEVLDMTKFGIVIRFDEDANPIFYHRSFVDFLFAQWIAKAYQINIYKSVAKHLYKKIVNEDKLHILNILFEENELHRAIFQDNIMRIEKIITEDPECWNNVDKLGRTALHAAAIYCSYSNLTFMALEILDLLITRMLQSNKYMNRPDSIMNWNWSEYIQSRTFNFACVFDMLHTVEIYLQLHRRKIENDNCLSPLFPTKYFHSIFLSALKSNAFGMISDLVLLQNFENKTFYNFYQACLGLLPEYNFSFTKYLKFEGELTPAHIACIYSNISMLQQLIRAGAHIDGIDAFGCTPLHYSIMNCCFLKQENIVEKNMNIEVVKLLLKAGANPNSVILREKEITSLCYAVQMKDINIVSLLLQSGANILARSYNEDTLLHLAVSLGCADIVRCLLHSHSTLRYLRNKQNETPLDIARKQNRIEIIELLSETDHNINIIKEEQMRAVYIGSKSYLNASDTPLHTAVCCDNINLIKVLLRKGADINVLDNSGNTPLHVALGIENIEVSTLLLSKGADIHVRDKYGQTPLLIAVVHNNIPVIQMILKNGSTTNIACLTNRTPLHAAIWNKNLYVIKLLLEKGANANAQDLDGVTSLHIAVQNGCEDSVTLLLGNGADPKIPDVKGNTPFHISILNRHTTISMLLLQKGANINVPNDRGETPFATAIFLQDIDTVRLLLNTGANLNYEDVNGWTPLIYASYTGNVELVKLLIEKGANINAVNKDGLSVLCLAAQNAEINIIELLLEANVDIDREGGTAALLCFISKGDINNVQLLLKRGICVNAHDKIYGYTPLLQAAAIGHADIVSLLLENGAHINVNCGEVSTPLHQAVAHKHQNIVKLLIDKGADINAKCKKGDTILCSAIKTGDISIVELLLEANADNTKEGRLDAMRYSVFLGDIEIIKSLLNKGVDLNIYNETNHTPLYIATFKKRADIVRLFLENGADVNIASRDGNVPFGEAVRNGQIEITKLLLDNGANVNSIFGDCTALHYKTCSGDIDFVKLLVEKGADVNVRTENGMTALDIAIRCAYTNIVKILLGERDLNTQTSDGEEVLELQIQKRVNEENTANIENDEFMIGVLYWAAVSGNLNIFEIALKGGVNVNVQNPSGHTPLHVAVLNNNEVIVEKLLENGADVNLKTNAELTPLCFAKLRGYTNITELFTAFKLSMNAH